MTVLLAAFAVFRAEDGSKLVLGKVAALGLTDEINDRHYVVVDGVDGRVHYADIGRVRPETLPERGMIVVNRSGKVARR